MNLSVTLKKITIILLCVVINECNSNKTLLRYLYGIKSISFQDCGSKYEMLHLSISSCTKIPCQMPLGNNVQFFAEFDDHGENSKYLKHHVQWTLNYVNSLATVSPDPCDITEQCPFQGIVGKAFHAVVHVKPNLPAVSGILRWEATNNKGVRVICYKVPVSITWH